jgi:shikimate kinase
LNASLFLVGPAGVGKTTTGKLLARALALPFVDSDAEIEARCGVKISIIFELEGEAGFRDREAEVIEELTQRAGIVLSTGGGAVIRQSNRLALAQRGYTVYLHAPPSVLFQRTRGDKSRPLLQTADPRVTIEHLYQVRDPMYREPARIVVDASRSNPSHLVAQVVASFNDYVASLAANGTSSPAA